MTLIELKKQTCPCCGKTAKKYYNSEKEEIIIICKAKNPCGYINKNNAK